VIARVATLRSMPTALITGTSTGIGEACVALLAARGWTIYAGVRRERDGERLRAAQTGDVRPVILDVTNRELRGKDDDTYYENPVG